MRIVFMGSSAASAESLRALLREEVFEVVGVVTQPDRPAGRGKVLTPNPLAQYAQYRGISEIIKPENVNDPEPMAKIKSWAPDVCVVVAYGQLLKKPLLDLPRFGCVNCHFSLLPRYRGAAPVIAALAAGDRKTGVTVMHMGEGLDDGPIMLQSYEPIYPDTTGGELMNDLALAGGVTLAKALRLLNEGKLPPEMPQNDMYASHVKKLKKSDGLIDWSEPVLVIERKIRAYNPWPGCYTFLPERFRKKGSTGRLAISRARIVKMDERWKNALPGTVLKVVAQSAKGGSDNLAGLVVKCGDTALMLTEVKPEGGRVMEGGEFVRGRAFAEFNDIFKMQ
jgi:methionyl-tRNA formyltransferase